MARSIETRPRCAVCHVLHRSDWCVLETRDLARLAMGQSRREYAPRETIFRIGDINRGIYCISAGVIGLRRIDEAGRSALVHIAYPGETLGYRSFLTKARHATEAEALEPSTVCFVNAATVSNVLADNPSLGLRFLRHATEDLKEAQDALLRQTAASHRTRLIHLLLVLLHRQGERLPDNELALRLPLSRRDIAAMVGTRHETLSRIIGGLEEEGLAEFSGRSVRVPDIHALADEISGHLN